MWKQFWLKTGLTLLIACLVIVLSLLGGLAYLRSAPGKSWDKPLPPLTASQQTLSGLLRQHVEQVASVEHHYATPAALAQSADYIRNYLKQQGFSPRRQILEGDASKIHNIYVDIPGANPIANTYVLIGAHYDSALRAPGANDNGSGVAALLELARLLKQKPPAKQTIRLVFFVNEEPPYYRTSQMGSLAYAKEARLNQDNIIAMLSLETLGYYRDTPDSQAYPVKGMGLVLPTEGNFLAFISNQASRPLLQKTIGLFREYVQFPSEGLAGFDVIPGIGWSDHWSFWQVGYPAIMLTDTAPFRYPHYHQPEDTPDKLSYAHLARITEGLVPVVQQLAN